MRIALAIVIAILATASMAGAQWEHVAITDQRILDMALEDGAVWLTINDTGLVRYDGTSIVFSTATSDISMDSWAYSLLVDTSGRKWLGRDAHAAIDRLDDDGTPSDFTDDEWYHLTYPEDVANYRVFSMAEDPDGHVWFGMRDENHNRPGTLELYVSDEDSVIHYDNAWEPFLTRFSDDDVRALAVDADGRLWIGYFAAGIDVWDYGDYRTYDDDVWEHYDIGDGLPSNRIFSLHATEDGQVLAGTQAGLAIFNPEGGAPVVIDDLPGEEVRSIDTDARRYIWVGTEAGVAMLYPNGSVIRTFGTSDGLANPTVERIAVDDASGTVWALTVGESIADTDLHWYESDISVPGRSMPVYPNPWREDEARTDITILGVKRGATIEIFDLTGQRVRTLDQRDEPYTWDTLDDHENEVPAGLYIIRVSEPGGGAKSARVAIIR
jgi:ligand-binding sensor domain-containing protein